MAIYSQSAVPGQAVPGGAYPGAGNVSTSGATSAVSSLSLTNTAATPTLATARSTTSSVTLTNTASAVSQIARTASSSVTLTNTASQPGLQSSASSQVSLANTATAKPGYPGSASSTVSLTNTATAGSSFIGAATSSVTLTAVTGAGSLRVAATSTSALSLVNTATGSFTQLAYAISVITLSNTAAGTFTYSPPAPIIPAIPDWRTLTPAALALLLNSTDLTLDTGVALLNADLSLNRDLSAYLDTSTGDVQWDGDAQVHRDCELTLTTALQWGTALLKVYRVMTDNPSGVAARFDRGVFVLNTPDTVLGATVMGTDGSAQIAYDITGQDRTYLLDRLLPDSYYVYAGTSVLTALAAVFVAAGLTGYLIDTSASASVVPSDMAWPLIPSDDDTTSTVTLADGTQVDSSGGTTWRNVINDLCSLITYRAVWADEQGMFRVGPYVVPSQRTPTQTLDSTSPTSTLGDARTVNQDLWNVPNQWTFTWANIPDSTDGSGNTISTTPTVQNGGVYQVNNINNGLSSQQSRGLIFPAPIQSLTAASPQDLVNQATVIVTAAQRVTTTITTTCSPNPSLSHFDIATYTEPGLSEQVQVTSWTENFDNSDTDLTLVVAQ